MNGALTITRRLAYRTARTLGNVQAVTHPKRIPARLANIWLGRNLVRRIWR